MRRAPSVLHFIQKSPCTYNPIIPLSIKRISADEFADDACGRDLVIDIRLVDIVEHFYHRADLLVAVLVWLDSAKKRENVLFEHGELIERRAVEDDVRLILEGQYPFALTAANRIPHCKCHLHRCPASGIIANRSAKKSQIACGNAVVIIEAEWQQRAYEDLEDRILIER